MRVQISTRTIWQVTYLTYDEVLSHLPYFRVPLLHRVEKAVKHETFDKAISIYVRSSHTLILPIRMQRGQ